MEIICLNIWGGRAGKDELLGFLKEYQERTDVFCLQEVWRNSYDDLEGMVAGGRLLDHSRIMTQGFQVMGAALPDYAGFFRPSFRDDWGLSTFVRKGLDVREEGDVFVHKERGYVPEEDVGRCARNLQYITLEHAGTPVTVMNVHGLWNGQGKGDSGDRLEQSDRIIAFAKALTNPYILCGDFNLTPSTKSLQKFREAGMRDLITEYGITSTRTSLYDKPERFADYAFVSEGIEVESFEVLPDEVSDHAALRLRIA